MQVAPVTFVRHAMPVTDGAVAPTQWHLDHDGIHAAGRLADRLEVGAHLGGLVASTEPKAMETAGPIGDRWAAPVVGDDRLREVERPWTGPGYRSVAHRYLRGELPEGWEPHEQVAQRAGAAIDEARDRAEGGPVVVVSHGLVLAVHLGARLGPDFDREAFWSCLAFPDAWGLDDHGTLHRPQIGATSR